MCDFSPHNIQLGEGLEDDRKDRNAAVDRKWEAVERKGEWY